MVQITQDEILSRYTTFQVGGPAEYFTIVKTEDELVDAVSYADEHSLKITVIGGGSNVLVSDDGVKGLVIKNEIRGVAEGITGQTARITAGAGEVFDDVVAFTVKKGYWGIENLSHIPGTVGATPIQNIGAYGVGVGAYIQEVRVFDTKTSTFLNLDRETCAFSYRNSIFKTDTGKKYIVCSVTYKLSLKRTPKITYKDLAERFENTTPTALEIRNAIIEIRSKKLPDWTQIGTAGSFFKNPIIPKSLFETLRTQYEDLPSFNVSDDMVKVPLGWILDKVCGIKGEREGLVGTYEQQALVIVNHGGATEADISNFAKKIQKNVLDATGITIEWEVTKIK